MEKKKCDHLWGVPIANHNLRHCSRCDSTEYRKKARGVKQIPADAKELEIYYWSDKKPTK